MKHTIIFKRGTYIFRAKFKFSNWLCCALNPSGRWLMMLNGVRTYLGTSLTWWTLCWQVELRRLSCLRVPMETDCAALLVRVHTSPRIHRLKHFAQGMTTLFMIYQDITHAFINRNASASSIVICINNRLGDCLHCFNPVWVYVLVNNFIMATGEMTFPTLKIAEIVSCSEELRYTNKGTRSCNTSPNNIKCSWLPISNIAHKDKEHIVWNFTIFYVRSYF